LFQRRFVHFVTTSWLYAEALKASRNCSIHHLLQFHSDQTLRFVPACPTACPLTPHNNRLSFPYGLIRIPSFLQQILYKSA
jgi:hypothetical protein